MIIVYTYHLKIVENIPLCENVLRGCKWSPCPTPTAIPRAPVSCFLCCNWNRHHLLYERGRVPHPQPHSSPSPQCPSPQHPYPQSIRIVTYSPRTSLLLRVNLLACFGSIPSFPIPLQPSNIFPAWKGWGELPWSSNSLDLSSLLSSPLKAKVLERIASICSIHFLPTHSLLFIVLFTHFFE